MKRSTTRKSATSQPLALTVLACALSLLSSQATTRYWNGSVSQDWSVGANFQAEGSNLPGVPLAGDSLQMLSWGTRPALVSSAANASLNDLHVNKDLTIGSGGVLDTSFLKLAESASATLTISGGALSAANHLDVGGYAGTTALLTLQGGSLTVGGLYLNLAGAGSGASFVNLDGGTLLDTGVLSINSAHAAVLDLGGGTLIVSASQAGDVNYWIANHNITAYDGTGSVNIDSVSNAGNLVLTGVLVPEPSTLALLSSAALALVLVRRKK